VIPLLSAIVLTLQDNGPTPLRRAGALRFKLVSRGLTRGAPARPPNEVRSWGGRYHHPQYGERTGRSPGLIGPTFMIDEAQASALQFQDMAQFQRNVTTLSRHAPSLETVLTSDPSAYTLLRTEWGLLYLDRHGRAVLKGPDPTYSLDRMEAFLGQPPRPMRILNLESVSADPEYWHDRIQHFLPDFDPAIWTRTAPQNAVNALVMIDQTSSDAILLALEAFHNASVFVHVVHDLDLFKAALHTMDWAAILRRCETLGIQYRLVPAPNGLADLKSIYNAIKHFLAIKSDLVLIYDHTDSAATKALVRKFNQEYFGAFSAIGFFRDEIAMYQATYDNLLTRGHPLLKRSPIQDGTALIVGSGPSLDARMDAIRAWSERCLVVACGTAIEALLRNHIRVDVCVILERGWHSFEAFEDISHRVDLSDVTCIASSVTDQQVASLFKETYFIIRPGANPSIGFARSHDHVLPLCNPTVSNMGASVASFLGYRRFLLFGLDYGSLDANKHHSTDTMYYKGSEKAEHEVDLPEKADATYGQRCATHLIFSFSKQQLEVFANYLADGLFVNLSDGQVISGTAPVHLAGLPYVDRIFPVGEAGCSCEMEGSHFDRRDLRYNPVVLDAFVARLRAALEQLSWVHRRDILSSLQAIMWQEVGLNPFRNMLRGTVSLMILSLLAALDRMTEDERARHEPGMRALVVAALDDMHAELRDLIVHDRRRFAADDPRMR
jgi:hypothetical protein